MRLWEDNLQLIILDTLLLETGTIFFVSGKTIWNF